ncbi:MAG: GlxA family transcriptional regulator [Proteobacteria bacterium]|nr:GlxA family transcriptional regulator [Pseudomonadota bacterium]MBU1584433.1 GlxA family transcriptional regulator [Pseudomonadota bacterium]MBU2451777.1 GlxA family transcriptional regulator [Pseudomonadota bacterium]MBU2627802.1 GlxA family transcriptional regulator [Pseudomonadota bacterium]
MKKVTILGLTDTASSLISGPADIFRNAGHLWNFIFKKPEVSYFDIEIVSPDGQPIKCGGNLTINAHSSIDCVQETDLLIIPSIKDIEETMTKEKQVIPWIKKTYEHGAHVAAICTGTFVLAETGLLDGKVATTHWGFIESFRQRYPNVKLKPERLITESGNIFTSGGSNACYDISLYLVRRYCGNDVARKLAKAFLHDLDRVSQAPWIEFQGQRAHSDKEIRNAQERLENQYIDSFNFDRVAQDFGMSRRTFERRFKATTGDSPLQYLQRVRVEAAKRILENENKSFDEVTYAVGYEDPGFFRKIFTQISGISPKEYRIKWGTPVNFSMPLK